MKSRWERSQSPPQVDQSDLQSLFPNVMAGQPPVELMSGGLRNGNYLITTRNGTYVVKVYSDNLRAKIQTNVIAFLGGMVPLAEIIDEVTFQDKIVHLMPYIRGGRLADRLSSLATHQKHAIYFSAGVYLGKIGSVSFQQPGFFDNQGSVAQPLEINADTYHQVLKQLLTDKVRFNLGHLTRSVIDFSDGYSHLLEEIDDTPRLVHGDYNPENILIDGTDISAILDWEFAFSGSPMFDIGNFLRFETDIRAGHVTSFVEGYETSGRAMPPSWPIICVLYDILSLITLLDESTIGKVKLADIRHLLQKYLEHGNNW